MKEFIKENSKKSDQWITPWLKWRISQWYMILTFLNSARRGEKVSKLFEDIIFSSFNPRSKVSSYELFFKEILKGIFHDYSFVVLFL